MNEFDVINSLRKIIKNKSALNLEDDVFFDKKNSLVASIDTYNEKTHYINFNYPNLITKKIIRSSISDLVSKGVDPKYLLISFSGSKKKFNKKNIKLITDSIKEEQIKYGFTLVGGDTTFSRNSSFSVCVFSFSDKIIRRNTCLNNDDIYLTGTIGDSSIGLDLLKKKIRTNILKNNYFINKYFKPNLPFGFHRELYKFANSSMDVSDGLLIDLKKIVSAKKLGFTVNFNIIPKSKNFNNLKITKKKAIQHLFNGDDYQILFTAKKKYRKIILISAAKWNQKVTRIGKITRGKGDYLKIDNKLNKIHNYQGYIHCF